jgi:branched-subunit amino acid aminotransferase/4-amino-4-deoxychorismate lyase
MDNYLVNNGHFILSNTPIMRAGNRGFQYADGLFESIRVIHGKPLFLSDHLNRLFEGAEALQLKLPEKWSVTFFEDLFQKLIALNNINSGRARLSVFRAFGGNYLPVQKDVEYLLELYPLADEVFELNKNGLSIDTFNTLVKHKNPLASFKTLNAQLYVLARMDAATRSLDDALILNEEKQIIEASSSNLFFVKNEGLYTPPLSDGGVGGIMRMQLINLAIELGIPVFECHVTPGLLLDAEEIFLSNAVSGVQWVVSFRNKRYYHKLSSYLIAQLNILATNLVTDLPGTE